jgi:hypothetical protein
VWDKNCTIMSVIFYAQYIPGVLQLSKKFYKYALRRFITSLNSFMNVVVDSGFLKHAEESLL